MFFSYLSHGSLILNKKVTNWPGFD
jgi:hypothetical protein